MEFHLTEFHFRSFPLRKCLKVPFPFVSVKTNFESSVKIPFPLMALCFRVNPYCVVPSVLLILISGHEIGLTVHSDDKRGGLHHGLPLMTP